MHTSSSGLWRWKRTGASASAVQLITSRSKSVAAEELPRVCLGSKYSGVITTRLTSGDVASYPLNGRTSKSEGRTRPRAKTLARRSSVPVNLDVTIDRRLSDSIEVAACYMVAEALTNAAKHAQASKVTVGVQVQDAHLCLSIGDDGIGCVNAAKGSGLIGLKDTALRPSAATSNSAVPQESERRYSSPSRSTTNNSGRDQPLNGGQRGSGTLRWCAGVHR